MQAELTRPPCAHRGPLFILILALMTLAAAACAGEDTSAVDRYGLRGRVTEARSGAAVEGAHVTFISDALDRSDTTTGDDGRYSMAAIVAEGIEFGTLTVQREGYRASPELSVYFDGTERTLDVKLERATDDLAGDEEE